MSEFSGSEIRTNNLESVNNDSVPSKDKVKNPLPTSVNTSNSLGLTEKGLAALQGQPLPEEHPDITSALSPIGLSALQDEDLPKNSK